MGTAFEHAGDVARNAAARFAARFGAGQGDGRARLFRAPGRINLIGEHTDYCGGLVMPAAIDRATVVAARANGTRRLAVGAGGFGEAAADLDALAPAGGWIDYVAGVAWALRQAGVEVPGADLWIESDVPVGAGVSSSAALEVAAAHALLALAGRAAEGPQIARWAQAAENDFVGMRCGIMDQYASACGVDGSALLLNCNTMDVVPVPAPDDACFLLVDSGVRHSHAGGEYGQRRAECEAAARLLGVEKLGVLRDAGLAVAEAQLTGVLARRARHVIGESVRVLRAAQALDAGDLDAVGELMDASHASLRDDMEVSVPAVDRLAAIAQETPGVYGARMMGGGFGGCVLALVAADEAWAARATIQARYAEALGRAPDAFVCRPVGGAGEIVPVSSP
jgi:galactokinase